MLKNIFQKLSRLYVEIPTEALGNSQKATALLLTIIVISLIMLIVLSISLLIIVEFKLVMGIEDSVSAYYAAETGVEIGLYRLYQQSPTPSLPYGPETNSIVDTKYTLNIFESGENVKVESSGMVKESKVTRKLEVIQPKP